MVRFPDRLRYFRALHLKHFVTEPSHDGFFGDPIRPNPMHQLELAETWRIGEAHFENLGL